MDRANFTFRNVGPRKKTIIYFISTGDTCRSPMAASYIRRLLAEAEIDAIDIRAAGVLTVTGLRASQEARQIMEAQEIDLNTHRSSQLSPEMIRRADLILGMTPYHVQKAIRINEEARGKTFLLQEYTRGGKNVQIQDPMGCTLEVFNRRFKEIRQGCDRLMKSAFIAKHVPAAADSAQSTATSEAANDANTAKAATKAKPSTQKAAASKTKATTQKASSKKATSKKATSKKVTAKKVTAKKASTKGTTSRKASTSKQAVSKKSGAKSKTSKKAATKTSKTKSNSVRSRTRTKSSSTKSKSTMKTSVKRSV